MRWGASKGAASQAFEIQGTGGAGAGAGAGAGGISLDLWSR